MKLPKELSHSIYYKWSTLKAASNKIRSNSHFHSDPRIIEEINARRDHEHFVDRRVFFSQLVVELTA